MKIVNIADYRRESTKGDNMSEKNILFSGIVNDLSNNYKDKAISEKDAIRVADMILDVSHKIGYKLPV